MQVDDLERRYFTELAAAFVRGKLQTAGGLGLAETMRLGVQRGLRLHKFKRTELPRVRKVLGILRGLAPESIVDVGSGRGAFLWPLLDAFQMTRVLAVDLSERRASDVVAVRLGGIERLATARMDARRLGLASQSVEVVTMLEVLEHLSAPACAVREAVRVARRCVIVSVPLHEDDNPEHVQLFSPRSLEELLRTGGARKVSFDYVLNHMIAVAMV